MLKADCVIFLMRQRNESHACKSWRVEATMEVKEEPEEFSRVFPSQDGLVMRKFVVINFMKYVFRKIFPVPVLARSLEEFGVVPMLWIPPFALPI